MKHKVKVTVLDKKLYPELQQQYCADPNSGVCACYNVGDEFMFYRDDERDDYWHMGAGTLIKSGKPDEGMLISPGTMHCGEEGMPFCSEAWGAVRPVDARLAPTGAERRPRSAGIFTPDCRAELSCTAG